MKNSTFLIIVLALALVFVCYKLITSTGNTKTPSPCKAVIDNIMTRTSVRSYTDRQVTQEQIDTLLQAAMAAPTAGNKQPWRIVVITDHKILNDISDNFQTMTMARKASIAVVMCGDVTATFEGEGRDYWIEDVSAATENLLLAAHAMGLGAVWCGIYPLSERIAMFSSMLKLPENIVPMGCVCIGYPDADHKPKDKWKPENVRYNAWDTEAK